MTLSFSLELLRENLGLSGPAGIWKLIAILFALLNLKSLPFVWHVCASLLAFHNNRTDTPTSFA